MRPDPDHRLRRLRSGLSVSRARTAHPNGGRRQAIWSRCHWRSSGLYHAGCQERKYSSCANSHRKRPSTCAVDHSPGREDHGFPITGYCGRTSRHISVTRMAAPADMPRIQAQCKGMGGSAGNLGRSEGFTGGASCKVTEVARSGGGRRHMRRRGGGGRSATAPFRLRTLDGRGIRQAAKG